MPNGRRGSCISSFRVVWLLRMNSSRRHLLLIGMMSGLLWLLPGGDGAVADDQGTAIGPARDIGGSVGQTWMKEGDSQVPSPLMSTTSTSIVNNVPTFSQPMSIRGKSFSPYVGAGFGSGYTSELDRSLNAPAPSSLPSDSGFRSLFGQSLVPNEVQMGVRLPF